MSAPASDLLEQAKQRRWYHALELAPGFATEGLFDLRPEEILGSKVERT